MFVWDNATYSVRSHRATYPSFIEVCPYDKLFEFLHGKSYGGWTQNSHAWWVRIFHEAFGGDTKDFIGGSMLIFHMLY